MNEREKTPEVKVTYKYDPEMETEESQAVKSRIENNKALFSKLQKEIQNKSNKSPISKTTNYNFYLNSNIKNKKSSFPTNMIIKSIKSIHPSF